jgi:hypothetical protein
MCSTGGSGLGIAISLQVEGLEIVKEVGKKVEILSLSRKTRTLRKERLGQVDRGPRRVWVTPSLIRQEKLILCDSDKKRACENLQHGSSHVNDLKRSRIACRR